LILDVLQDHR